MKKAPTADCHRDAGIAGRSDPDGLLRRAAPRNDRAKIGLWLAVLFGFACLATAYFFAFRAARIAQIQEVPLATKGAKP